MVKRRRGHLEQITPEDIVVYTLRTDQLPRQPDKEWRGNVLQAYPMVQMVRVASLEVGYEGCEEDVRFSQILWIEKAMPLPPDFRT